MKGERIVTNLVGKVVTPRSEFAAEDVWPGKNWPEMPIDGGTNPVQGKVAEVVAVYLREGVVFFMVRNVINGNLIETRGDYWRVIK